MSFFLCRLTDPAPTEGFSDYSDLIAWGKHFLAITYASGLARWVFPFTPWTAGTALAWHAAPVLGDTAGPREGQSQPGWHTRLPPRSSQPFRTSPAGWMLPAVALLPAACLGEPWGGRIHSPTLRLAQAARAVQAARQVLGGRGGPRQPPTPLCCTGAQPG